MMERHNHKNKKPGGPGVLAVSFFCSGIAIADFFSADRYVDRDVRGILDTQGDALDFAYIEGWLDELDVRELWNQVRAG